MFKINIVCVGKLKEEFYLLAQNEYTKRLKRFCELKIVELGEFALPQNPSDAQILQGLDEESKQILPLLRGLVFVCDPRGKEMDSVEFCENVFKGFDNNSEVTFVIGSSYGLSQKVKEGRRLVSFSKMTFPHHLMRVVLLEQIYRAFCIKNNVTYHK